MRILALILTALILLNPAAQAKDCQVKTDRLVEKLEEVYADKNIEGPIVGDRFEPELKPEIFDETNGLKLFLYEVPHQNVLGEAWYTNYEIVVDPNSCKIESYKYHGESERISCINHHRAQDLLRAHLAPLIDLIPNKDFPWLSHDERSKLTSEKASLAVNSLQLLLEHKFFMSEPIFSQKCDTGNCIGAYRIYCDGKVGIFTLRN